MKTVTVYLNWQERELTEEDVKRMLIERALEVARHKNVRGYLSAVRRAIQSVTNEIYDGRRHVLGYYGHIEPPFPEAWELKDRLLSLLGDYVMQQETMEPLAWDAGWEKTVIPQIKQLL